MGMRTGDGSVLVAFETPRLVDRSSGAILRGEVFSVYKVGLIKLQCFLAIDGTRFSLNRDWAQTPARYASTLDEDVFD
jgi:hypothetical protein